MKVAKCDPHILAIADDKIKNDAELFLTLCKNKLICAQYIGRELRQNKQFLLALDSIDNKCWRYIFKIHVLPSTVEEKISMWCLFWLSNGIRKYGGKWNTVCATINKKDGTEKFTSWIGFLRAGGVHPIRPDNPKEEIIEAIHKERQYTINPYYSPLTNADAEIAERMLNCDSQYVLGLSNLKELLEDYNFLMTFWQKTKCANAVAHQSIRNFSSDRQLAKILLEDQEWGALLEFFSAEIRGDKEYILKLLFTPSVVLGPHFGKLLPRYLIYVTDELKQDEDFLKRIGAQNRRSLKYWEKQANSKDKNFLVLRYGMSAEEIAQIQEAINYAKQHV